MYQRLTPMENHDRKPNVALIIALPQELSIRKPVNGLFYQEPELDLIREEIALFVNPECKVNLTIEFSSVGKVNAAICFTEIIFRSNEKGVGVEYVINAGSAGAIEGSGLQIGNVVQCNAAMQSDLDLSGIGNNTIGTNFNSLNRRHDNHVFHDVNCNLNLHWLPKTICASSDKFPIAYGQTWYQARHQAWRAADTLDQECAALAVVLNKNPNIQGVFLKYIANIVTKAQLEGKESLEKSGEEWINDLEESSMCQDALLVNTKLVIEKIVEFEKRNQNANAV